MKAHKFNTDFFELGEVKYAAGKSYKVTEETTRCVAIGIAEPVNVNVKEAIDVPDSVGAADEQAALAKAAAISDAEDALAKAKTDATTAAQAALDAHVAADDALEGAPKINLTAIALAFDEVAHTAVVEVEAAQQYLDGLLSV